MHAAGYLPPAYTTMWQCVARGLVPQVVRRNNRLFFDDADVEAIAQALGAERLAPTERQKNERAEDQSACP